MGPLIGSYREDDKETISLPRTPHSRRTRTTDDGLMAFDSSSEFSFDDNLTDEGRLSRSLQSWMPDYTIVPIEPMVKPPKQPVYSGRLGKKLSLKRIPSDESIATKLSLLSCSTRDVSPEERSSTATKRRRKKKNLSSRAPSAAEKVVSKWEEFARQRAKGALDKFSKTHNAMRMDVVQRFEDDESEAFRMMDKDEKKMLISVGIIRSRLFAGQLKKTPSLSDVRDSFTPSQPRHVQRALSVGAKPRSRGINLEEIREQRMREKIALMQQRQRSRGGRRSFLSHRQLTRTTLTSSAGSVAPATPSPRSGSPVNQEEKVSVWKGDRQILEMDLRRGLTKRVQKKIMSTTMAINLVTGYGESNERQTVIGRHEEFPSYVEEDYCNVPKIVQRIRITPDLSLVIKDDIRVRMGRPRYHEIRIKDLEMWNRGQVLNRSHRNLKVFNWLHSLKESDFDKDIEPYIDDSVPASPDDVDVLHVEAADEPDIKPLYMKKFNMKGSKKKSLRKI
ncbi:uncharacterized protein LOC133180971 [Saccostrea echinata]|uniref:uncharacterized protein LOC133180971 n=1 Tax=Saccostrea echinata TaxID=191078 RepID=UPI002A80A439|nr:uncharacterized protein LOC133180971 [Saccostrea echinata]